MTQNLAALERQIQEMTDLASIPTMTQEERIAKLAEYQAEVDQLAAEERQLLEQANPDQGMNTRIIRGLASAARKHRAARKSLERIQQAIARAQATGQP